jgi:hypothetical protein
MEIKNNLLYLCYEIQTNINIRYTQQTQIVKW